MSMTAATLRYSALPAWMWRAPRHPLALQFWWARGRRAARLPVASLHLRFPDGSERYIAHARLPDFRVRVELSEGAQVLECYWHYISCASYGCRFPYHALEWACRTYVKFGHCEQERRALQLTLRLRPSRPASHIPPVPDAP